MTRIGVDVRLTRQMSAGMQQYTRELHARLPRVAPEFDYRFFTAGSNFGIEEQWKLPAAMRAAKIGLAHFTSLYMPVLAPRPYVVTIHDLIHLRFPQFFKSKVGPYYATVVKYAARRAARVITDDERTVADIGRFLGVDPQRCRVIALGAGEDFLSVREPYRAAQPYFLYAGNHRAHKNLATLFEAWSALPPAYKVDLYVTGEDDFGTSLRRYQRPERQIVVLGDVPSEKLPALYAGARALVYPSLCEGFGLPMLEAMAARCPVIASEDAAPRVLQSAMLLFSALDAGALRTRLERIFDDEGLRNALVNEGRTLAESLTWERCARETAAVYREVLEEVQ